MMKKFTLILSFLFFTLYSLISQINIVENLDSYPIFWPVSTNFVVDSSPDACEGTGSLKGFHNSAGSAISVESNNIRYQNNGESISLSFDLRSIQIVNGNVSLQTKYSFDDGANYTFFTATTLDGANTCSVVTGTIPASSVPKHADFKLLFTTFNFSGDGGQYDVFIDNVSLTQTPAPIPSNDNVANATLLTLDASCINTTTHGATRETGEPAGCVPQMAESVWYKFVATTCGNVVIGVTGQDPIDWPSKIALFKATNPSDFSTFIPLECDSYNNNNPPHVVSNYLAAGTTYYIQVFGSFLAHGDFCIEVNNDGCCNGTGNVALFSNPSVSGPKCNDANGWTYYKSNSNPGMYFAIDWKVGNELAKREALPAIFNGVVGANEDGTHGTYIMDRHWNVNLQGETIVTPVDVRFYYDPAEKAATTAAMTNGNNNGIAESPAWFKSIGTPYLSNVPPSPNFPGIVQDLTSNATCDGCTENGVSFVQFSGLTSFSGGSWAEGAGLAGASALAAVLPVNLVDFDARALENTNEVSWTTSSEVNNAFQIIERSEDGEYWMEFEKLDGQGNAFSQTNYSIVDFDPPALAYYRLKTVDYDGHIEIFDPKSVRRENNASKTSIVALYPNPASSSLNINISAQKETTAILSITDIKGKKLILKNINLNSIQNIISLDISHIQAGMYMVNINSNEFSNSKKIIVSK